MKICFTVPGQPYGKPRPRVTKNGTYTPDKCASYEALVRIRYKEAAVLRGFHGFDGAIKVSIKANFSIPVSWSVSEKKAALLGKVHPTKKPDCDNISKVILDALNGIAYGDDASVIVLEVEKRYVRMTNQEPSVYVEIEDLEAE